jgi:hypothetical protein
MASASAKSSAVWAVSPAFLLGVVLVLGGPPPAAGQPQENVTICHIPPGNPANAHTITVGAPAVTAHLAHGDTEGACPVTPAPPPGGTLPTLVICHRPPDNPASPHTITIQQSALASHLAHGDLVGACATQCEAVCNDGDACTVDSGTPNLIGQCSCSHAAANCDDGNVCTADSCDPRAGCVQAPQAGFACDDGNACTTGEACSAQGQCSGGTQIGGCCVTDGDCDQTDACAPQVCAGTSCEPRPITCDQPDACTAAACDPATGCVAASACDDGNECTADTCDPALGCGAPEPVVDGTPCGDGTATCQGGFCTAG